MTRKKIAIIASHPVQYQTPFFKKLAKESWIDLTVYFCWDFGIESTYDKQFGRELKWDIPMLGGYHHVFLKNFSPKPSSDFWGQINPGIIKKLYVNKYDTVLVYGWNSFTNWLVFLTAFFLKIPIFLQGESPLNQELKKNNFKIHLKKLVLGNLFKTINSFLYIGKENKKFYAYYGVPEKKLFFSPYAVDNERFMKAKTEIDKNTARKKINIPAESFVVLFVGKLIEKKRPMDLLCAYELLTANYQLPVIPSLVFVGDGTLRQSLEDYVKARHLKNVFFLGFQNQLDLPFCYAAADVFVLPSGLGETWGLVVNEAMCFGLPVLVSDIVGCGPDMVRSKENGFICKVGDIKSLSENILSLVMDSNLKKIFSRKSEELVKNYSYEKDISGLANALQKTDN